MSLGALAATFVVAVILHNVEEALFLPAWSRRAGRWYPVVAPATFAVAVVAVTAVFVGSAVLAFAQGPRTVGAYLFFGHVAAMVANAVVPHLALTMASRTYMPGTATALALNLPLGTWLLWEGMEQRWVAPGPLVWAASAVALALLAAIRLLLRPARG